MQRKMGPHLNIQQLTLKRACFRKRGTRVRASSRKKHSTTASELTSQLQQHPPYQARMQQAQASRQESSRRHRVAAAPVIKDLERAGFPVDSLDQLRRTGSPYEAAVPVLLKWLPLVADMDVKDSIVRALSVPWARPTAALPLIAEFRDASGPASGLKWTIGNALAVVADDSVFEEISEMAREKRHGKAREMLAVALANMKDPRAVELLIELLGDDEVAGHALIALAKLRARKARRHVQRLLSHSKVWVRREAKKTLAKLQP